MTINKAWHEKHRMPKSPSTEQRLEWHIAHAKACNCRKIPESIQRLLAARKINRAKKS